MTRGTRMTAQHQTLPSAPNGRPPTRTAQGLRRCTPLLLAVLLAPTLAACGPGGDDRAAGQATLTASVDTPSDSPTADDPSTAPGPIPTETAAPLTPTRPTPTATTATPTVSATTTAASVAGSCTRTLGAYPQLDPGATGPAVSALQCFLNDADFGPVAVDGTYGATTRAAVAKVEATFEGSPGKPGHIDGGFWVAVISRALGDGTLKTGSKGADVTTLQRALRAAGATLAVDGVFGADTKKAVRALQAANRIGVDGVVGQDTLFLLKSGATIG